MPAATSSAKGAVIPGTGLAVDGSGQSEPHQQLQLAPTPRSLLTPKVTSVLAQRLQKAMFRHCQLARLRLAHLALH